MISHNITNLTRRRSRSTGYLSHHTLAHETACPVLPHVLTAASGRVISCESPSALSDTTPCIRRARLVAHGFLFNDGRPWRGRRNEGRRADDPRLDQITSKKPKSSGLCSISSGTPSGRRRADYSPQDQDPTTIAHLGGCLLNRRDRRIERDKLTTLHKPNPRSRG